jgi:hypothetical protein
MGTFATRIALAGAYVLALALGGAVSGQSAYRLAAEVRIGAMDGAYALTEPGVTTVARNGVLAVSQPMESLVRLFRPDGSAVGIIGRRGDGPGEFRAIVNMGFRGDSLWVTDPLSRRLSYFALDGRLLTEITWPGSMYLPDQPLPNGTFAGSAVTRNGAGPVEQNSPWRVTLFSRDGVQLKAIATLHTYSRELTIGGRKVLSPISDGAISSLSPDGGHLAVVDRRVPERGARGTFSITWINMSNGDTLGRQSFGYQPERMPREAVGQLVARLAGSGAPPEYIADMRQALEAQSFVPPVSRVQSADDAVWIARESMGRAEVRWERYTITDGLTGFILLPWKSRIVAARAQQIWVVEKDAFDVPYVVRYRLLGAR